MGDILLTALSYVTPGAVKAVLALAALIGMIVSFARKGKGGTVTLVIALAGWILPEMLGKHAYTPFRIALTAVLIVMTLLMRRFRWAGWLNFACLLAAIAADLLYVPWLLRGMLMIGDVRSLAEAVYALLCLCTLCLAVAYSVCLAVWKRPAALREEPPVPAASPLPEDVTLEELLPAAEPQPAVHTVAAPAKAAAAALPATLLQTGIGAEILRCKRRLDAGEITPEEFARRKAALMRQEP